MFWDLWIFSGGMCSWEEVFVLLMLFQSGGKVCFILLRCGISFFMLPR